MFTLKAKQARIKKNAKNSTPKINKKVIPETPRSYPKRDPPIAATITDKMKYLVILPSYNSALLPLASPTKPPAIAELLQQTALFRTTQKDPIPQHPVGIWDYYLCLIFSQESTRADKSNKQTHTCICINTFKKTLKIRPRVVEENLKYIVIKRK